MTLSSLDTAKLVSIPKIKILLLKVALKQFRYDPHEFPHVSLPNIKFRFNGFELDKLSSCLGRRYARVSGDFNPIHLNKWSVKLVGFKRHIIHGMWAKSYCISSLEKLTPSLFLQGFEVNTIFKQPLYLPCDVNLAVQAVEPTSANSEQYFEVAGIGANRVHQPVHLIGNTCAI